jgi:hypothetical protein
VVGWLCLPIAGPCAAPKPSSFHSLQGLLDAHCREKLDGHSNVFAERANLRALSAIHITAITSLPASTAFWEKSKKPSIGSNEASIADLLAGLSSNAIQT